VLSLVGDSGIPEDGVELVEEDGVGVVEEDGVGVVEEDGVGVVEEDGVGGTAEEEGLPQGLSGAGKCVPSHLSTAKRSTGTGSSFQCKTISSAAFSILTI